MMGLLVFKEKLKQLYGKYNRYMIPAVKFLLGASSFFLISSNVGFMARLKNPLVPVVMGLVAAVVPCGVTAFFAGCFLVSIRKREQEYQYKKYDISDSASVE